MFVWLLRLLGFAPRADRKSGKREAAWGLVTIALIVTGYAMHLGADMVTALIPVLVVLWPSVLALVGAAYKLEYDKAKLFGEGGQKPDDEAYPPGYPRDIAPPEGFAP